MKKYILDGVTTYYDPKEAAEAIIGEMDDEVYDKMLDECYGQVEIGGLFYSMSLALKKVDPIAYGCGRNDYYNGLREDLECELERMQDGDCDTLYGVELEVVGEEDD